MTRRGFFGLATGAVALNPAEPIISPRMASLSGLVRDGVSPWVVSSHEKDGEHVMVVQHKWDITDSDVRRLNYRIAQFIRERRSRG